jgi:uncharacterized membrane protein
MEGFLVIAVLALVAAPFALIALLVVVSRLSARVSRLEQEIAGFVPASAPAARPDPDFPRSRPPAQILAGTPQPRVEPPPAPQEPVPLEAPAPPEPPGPAYTERELENLGGIFERFVGGRLLIWIGGIALAVAGLFLVRHSIEIGLITPPVRMLMAAAFGLLLVGAGEYSRSRPDSALDERVAQSLVGAGVLVLYATAYGAHVLYGLLSMGTASALMVAIAAGALALALRHGAPTAVMGLVGGFATPLLVGNPSETSIPLLTYLALLNIASFALAERRGWTWLAASAVVLSFGWTAVLALQPPAQALPAGVFVVVLSIAASMVRAGGGWHLEFLRPAAIGLVQLAVLVGRTDLGLPAWGLFGALSLACFFLATRKAEYRPLPLLAVGLTLLLLFLKAIEAAAPDLPLIAAGITLLFAGGGAAAALRKGPRLIPTLVACAGAAGPALILRIFRPELLSGPGWGLLMLLLSAGPLLLAWRVRSGRPLFVSAATAALLLCAAAADLLPDSLLGGGWLLVALGAAFAARRATGGLGGLALAVAGIAASWSFFMGGRLWGALAESLIGMPALVTALPSLGTALQVLLLPSALLALLWWLLPPGPRLRPAPLILAGVFAAAAVYVMFKQVFALSNEADFVARGLAERTLINQALFLAGWLICTGKLPIPALGERERWIAGVSLTGLAAARLVWFDLLLHNPAFADQNVGAMPVANLLAPAYILSAFWLYRARRGADSAARSGLWLVIALASLTAGVMLMVRQLFHGAILTAPQLLESESYGYSLAGLLLSIVLLLSGVRLPDKALRLAGLILLTATIFKVFVFDARVLEGVLRILSFLGLGVALIGIGKLYGTVLRAEAKPERPEAPV